jgi:predicted TIM-barrel fold metal-dependent hydrolase
MERDLLRNAERDVREQGLDRRLVIDADVHHLNIIRFLGPYMDEPWRQMMQRTPVDQFITTHHIGDRAMAGRIRRPSYAGYTVQGVGELRDADLPAPVRDLVRDLARMGVDYSVVFPNDLLNLGLHPDPRVEVAVARGYARWITERVLPHEPRIGSLLYLPLADPEASLSLIEEYGDKRGIIGFLVTTARYERLQDNAYARVFGALEERGLPLGFHGAGKWSEDPYQVFDSFLAAHALSFPMFNAMHLANLVLAGIPERFPKLRVVFFEGGAACLPWIMGRLDTAYLMRRSEAPLLKRRPSEYMRDFFYTIQPIEHPDRPGQLQAIFDEVGRSQILFGTDYPHWDFDMPRTIVELGFLSEEDKTNILALNAVRAFGLDVDALTALAPVGGARG